MKTPLFHGTLKNNMKNSRVNGLLFNGEWLVEPSSIQHLIYEHFEARFKEPLNDRPLFLSNYFKQIPSSMASDLVKPFSSEEIKSAVWDCGGEKAPGPDGFNFNVIKKF